MATVRVTLQGLDEVKRKLRPGITDGPVRNFLNRGGAAIEAQSKVVTPVDTGRLRSSITALEPAARSVEIGPNTEYAWFVEFGTSKMRAQPYMQPGSQAAVPFIKGLVPILAAEIEADAANG